MTDSSYEENKGGSVLKTDVLGRVKTGAVQREAMLDEFERSGLSGTKFAAVAGVNYQTFASWVQKRRKATGAYHPVAGRSKRSRTAKSAVATMPALGWVEAVVETPKQEAAAAASEPEVLRLELPSGASLHIASEAQAVLAARLLKALGNPSAGVSC
jgi:hypothetical protein